MDIRDSEAISPRKKMAMGKGGSFSCDAFPHTGAAHPDAAAKTGSRPALGEGERAVGEGLARGKNEPMAQQAPSHGPMNHTNVAWTR